MILYFTGTDNSLFIAKRIAELTGDSLISLKDRIKKNDRSDIKVNGSLVFVVPTYAWRIPRIVEEWINHTSFIGTCNAYFVMNCGDDIGNAKKYLRKLCRRKGFHYMGVTGIVMPENYIARYGAPVEAVARQIIERALPIIDATAVLIKEKKVFPEVKCNAMGYLYSSIINSVFYRFLVKADRFTATESCIGCGKCVIECPLNNIRLEDKRPVWGTNCTHCMACICKCPTSAIEYGEHSVGKVRYRCPLIK